MSKISLTDITSPTEKYLMQLDGCKYFIYKDDLYFTSDQYVDDYQIECYLFENDQINSKLLPRDTRVTPVIINSINYEKMRA